jgi:CRISPR-associated protein Cmr2
MTAHLLALSIGPVQEFIAAARRTRDLWFGSYLLSEISKATAKSVQDQGGRLIFPAPACGADLKPGSPLNVANVILAELNDSDPATVAGKAKEAARKCWCEFAGQVFSQCEGIICKGIWNAQVDDVIEFYAAWRPYAQPTYQTDRAALMRLLAARKRCRDFLPAKGYAGIPKSSLDGLRESVLRPRVAASPPLCRGLRLRDGEQLDVVGLVKRAWQPEDGNPSYPSVARIAADPWIRRLQSKGINLGPLAAACRALGRDVVHELNTAKERGHPQYAAFAFEGTVLYRSRHPDLCQETGIPDNDPKFKQLVQALEGASQAARGKGLPPEPSPYLAVLVADGDRMGAALSKLASPDEHRQFSQALAGFARKAAEIVQEHQGVLVYSGGDDVLALVPVDRCLDCADALHEAFGTALAHWSERTSTDLTLSVGLAIAHFMEPLEDLLRYGRAAEKHAKQPRPGDIHQADRNGLAVHAVKRGGEPVAVRMNWPDDSAPTNPAHHLRQLADWLADQSVSGTVPYDLHALARVYERWPAETVRDAIRRDVLAVLERKQPRGSSKMHGIKGMIQAHIQDAQSLRGLADQFLVAKAIGVSSAATG